MPFPGFFFLRTDRLAKPVWLPFFFSCTRMTKEEGKKGEGRRNEEGNRDGNQGGGRGRREGRKEEGKLKRRTRVEGVLKGSAGLINHYTIMYKITYSKI